MKLGTRIKFCLLALAVVTVGLSSLKSNASEDHRALASLKSGDLLTVSEQIENAKKAGNVVFLLVSGGDASGVNTALNIANQAKAKVKKSTVIQMDRDDSENKELVTRFGLSKVPVPFILVISAKGLTMGGYPSGQATAELLLALIPSPKYETALLAINEKKAVFVVASKKSFTDKSKVLSICKQSVTKMNNAAVIVEVDLNDAYEAAFMKQLGVNTATTNTVIVTVNSCGSVTGNFTGVQSVQTLVEAATKVAKSCCPSGSGSGCGPKK